ncbi:MAG TPA: hypothetical protein VMG10_14485 [Gemmataceae bacterium]|nr:hypothetical protein [Gemmataceae bacterium]
MTLALAASLIVAESAWLRQRRRARNVARANEQVQEKIAAARVNLAAQHWDIAIGQLEDALDVREATNRDAVPPVLEEARRGQAEAMFEAAGLAIAHRQIDDALRLLRAYVASPQAEHHDRARLLRDDLERALSDDAAASVLARLSDEALTVFVEKGQLTVDDGLHTAAIRAIFHETLRRNAAKEVRQREARREVARLTEQRRAAEHERHIARLRAAPSFQSLTAYLTRTREHLRERQQLAQRKEAEVAELFQQLGVNDAAEQEKLRADFLGGDAPANLREQIERERAEIKRAFRNATEPQPADRELFNQLVDQEVDAFLKLLPSS